MQLRGPVVEVGDRRTVETSSGTSELVEVRLRPDGGRADAVTVTLWNKWAETADYLDAGMELLVTNPEEDEFRGEVQYATGRDSMVVVEPDFLVNVTDVRSWVQCPRMYYLNKLAGVELVYPVVKGTIVHEVFGDLLRDRSLDTSIPDRVAEAGLELGVLDRDADAVAEEVRDHASAIDGWLSQGTLPETDGAATAADSSERDFGPVESEWRSEQTLVSETYGMKGRADAVRRGMPVELKTGKNTKREPRFQDKVQATCYALLLGEENAGDDETHVQAAPDTGTLLYTKNAAVERTEETGDLSPAKEFSIGPGLLQYVVRTRNALAAMEFDASVPTGYEADAKCEYCFEQDTCMAVSGRLDQESKAGQVGTAIPEAERDYFDRFYRAIEAERREVHREYVKLWDQTAEERAEDDRALIDLEPLGRTQREGGRWELRADGTGAVSKIREGDVVLASDGHPIRGRAEMARVEQLDEEIVVTADEPVELRRLDVYPSEIGVSRMLTSLHDALLKQSAEQKAALFGRRDPAFAHDDTTYIDNNAAQNEAVSLAVRAEDYALIHGPPGTGKTYTLARTVRALVEQGERVLLTAFTNRAVDNALEALREQDFDDFVRVGTETGVRPDMQDFRLTERGDPAELADELRSASVVAATTASCGSSVMRGQEFDVALVDEAGQLTEPGALAAVNLAERFVLVGDHQQLPPVVRAEGRGEDRADLSASLFERLIDAHPEASVMLDRQYRMAQRIQAFASREFYDGELRPATGEVAGQRLDDLPAVETESLPAHLRDSVAFVDPDGRARGNTNPDEAAAVAQTVQAYLDAGVAPNQIGVIAPYRAQVAEIGKRAPDGVAVDTVDRFQGSSKEVVVVSFVATGELDGPIFEDYRRINVALTRAKKALVLVGDAEALATDPVYGRMVEWAR